MMKSLFKKKFTLLELLVVVAIIGILVSLLLPSLGRARGEARKAVCLSNLKQVGIQITLYVSGADDTLPGIIDSFFTEPVVKQNNLPGFLRLIAEKEIDEDYELLSCPSFTQSYSGRIDSRTVSMVNAVGSMPDTHERAFGRPSSSQEPKKLSTLKDLVNSIAVYEIFKGSRAASHIPIKPLHGYKGTYPLRNELRFDNSAVTQRDLESVN